MFTSGWVEPLWRYAVVEAALLTLGPRPQSPSVHSSGSAGNENKAITGRSSKAHACRINIKASSTASAEIEIILGKCFINFSLQKVTPIF